jgi:hypothetical protein
MRLVKRGSVLLLLPTAAWLLNPAAQAQPEPKLSIKTEVLRVDVADDRLGA